ncbi:MAG: hypothetical protein V3U68_01505, partial [Bacteroidota bacterium]
MMGSLAPTMRSPAQQLIAAVRTTSIIGLTLTRQRHYLDWLWLSLRITGTARIRCSIGYLFFFLQFRRLCLFSGIS